MKWNKETTQALRDSIKHHEDNLHKLRTAKRAFVVGYKYFEIGDITISVDANSCALCEKFVGVSEVCLKCPLKLNKYKCSEDNSPWQQIIRAKSRPEAIKAEENMVRVLKEVLGEENAFEVGDRIVWDGHKGTIVWCEGEKTKTRWDKDDTFSGKAVLEDCTLSKDFVRIVKEEFEIGDRVKCINPKSNKANTGGFNKDSIYKVEYSSDTLFKIKNDNGCFHTMSQGYLSENFKKTGENTMIQYKELEARIGKVTAWNQESDDIMQEIRKHSKTEYDILIPTHNYCNDGYDIEINIVKTANRKNRTELEISIVASFVYTNQYSKLEAFKKALMWLLDHSDIKKAIIGKEVIMEFEDRKVKAKILEEM